MTTVSAYIIAYNEAEKIRAAVESVLWADEIVLADSHSTDGTDRIAAELGARVIQVPFRGFGHLRNRAVAACRGDWIFSLDADERCTPAVRDEILTLVAGDPPADVFFVPRRNYFMGRWIRHSGWYPNYRQPQLFRRGALTYREEAVHEGFELRSDRPPGYLRHAIWQFPFRDLAEIQRKALRYSTLGARRLADEGRRGGLARGLAHGLWAFAQHYLLKRGFLDGGPGFVIALGNFEGTFYKYAKRCELEADWSPPAGEPLTRPRRRGVPGAAP